MTELEWLECSEPDRMLAFLRGTTADRKLRLFDCACWRLAWEKWHASVDERSRHAVDAAEAFADGLTSAVSLSEAQAATELASREAEARFRRAADSDAAWDNWRTALAAYDAARVCASDWSWRMFSEVCHQQGVLRCIFGNPLRHIAMDPSWLERDPAPLLKVAQSIYDERAFERLPMLGNLVQDAGCRDAALLAHCHEKGPHFRGCWVLDVILGMD